MTHEFLCRGARVRICNGRIEVLTEPAVHYCPYVESVYGIKSIDKRAVECIMRFKIEKYGLCNPHRCFETKVVVPFGSSEIISVCMRKGLLDCAVTVCEGAGTVISWNPDLVQGIGARLTGILRTSPIKEIVDYIENNGGKVLDTDTALIDQPLGVKRALSMGFKRIAVTVIGCNAKDITEIRDLQWSYGKVKIAIFSTCNTLIKEEDLVHLEKADIVCASASKLVRARIGPKATLQLGVSIPVFVLTELGRRLAFTYLMNTDMKLVIFRAKMPYIVEEKQPKLAKDHYIP
ncbi:MAG: hypothetical protein DRJ49_03910 [Thermoprotei archaeon]|nr:MAG: hypothetical protein DRJ49_03910 [Thermoprotei archaeon]